MKNLFYAIIIFLMFVGVASAETFSVAWDTPPGAYETYVYVSEESGSHDIMNAQAYADPGVEAADIENAVPGATYYIVATHFDPDTCALSGFSAEISFTVPLVCNRPVVTPLPEIPTPEPATGLGAS